MFQNAVHIIWYKWMTSHGSNVVETWCSLVTVGSVLLSFASGLHDEGHVINLQMHFQFAITFWADGCKHQDWGNLLGRIWGHGLLLSYFVSPTLTFFWGSLVLQYSQLHWVQHLEEGGRVPCAIWRVEFSIQWQTASLPSIIIKRRGETFMADTS